VPSEKLGKLACIKYFADSNADPVCLSLARIPLRCIPACLYSDFWESAGSRLCFENWFLEGRFDSDPGGYNVPFPKKGIGEEKGDCLPDLW